MSAAKVVPHPAVSKTHAVTMIRQHFERSLAIVHALQAMHDNEEGWQDRSECKLLELCEDVIGETFQYIERLEPSKGVTP